MVFELQQPGDARKVLFNWLDVRHDVTNELVAAKFHAELLAKRVKKTEPRMASILTDLHDNVRHVSLLLDGIYNGPHRPFDQTALTRSERLAINTHIPWVRSKVPELMDDIHRNLETASEEVGRLGPENQGAVRETLTMIRPLMDHARNIIHGVENERLEKFDLRELLHEFEHHHFALMSKQVKLTRRVRKVTIGDAITLQMPRARTPIRMYGNKAWLMRILKNICNNAVQAKARKIRIDVAQVVSKTGANRKTPHVQIRISNDGDEMSKDVAENAFTRGYTSGKARGTGLGLDIVKGAVQDWPIPRTAHPDWNNEIYLRRFDANPGQMSVRFVIKLPLSAVKPAPVIGRQPARKMARNARRLLTR